MPSVHNTFIPLDCLPSASIISVMEGAGVDPNYTDEETELLELKSFTVRMRGMMGNTWELLGTHCSLLNQILPEQEPGSVYEAPGSSGTSDATRGEVRTEGVTSKSL